MIEQLTFGQTHLIWPVIIGSALLWLLFIWKEWTSERGLRFYTKVFLSLVAVSALAIMALQPNIQKEQQIKYIAILSHGFEKTDLDSLTSEHKNLDIINYRPGIDLTNDIQSGEEVFILGQGLRSFDLWQLDKARVHFLEGSSPAGVSRLKYAQKNEVGNELMVEGEYHKGSKGQQLVLMGPGKVALDSVQLTGIETQSFKLKTVALVKGKFEYAFIEKDSLGLELSSAPLPVTIKEKTKLNILIINQFPSFETKYLKNFLAESGHLLKVRSQVSTDRYKYEYFNTLQKGAINLSSKTLNDIDLLIIDASSLQKASRNMRQLLQTAIDEEGLGVFIQADESLYGSTTSLLDISFLKQVDKEAILKNFPNVTLNQYPYLVKNEDLLEIVEQSEKGIVTAYKKSGAGRIGTSVLQNTYELILEGKADMYQNLWSHVISRIGKRKALETAWRKNDIMAYQDQPFHFEINTTQEHPLVNSQEGFSIPLARDIDLKELWIGTTYPRKLGWHQLIMKHDSTEVFNFYVLDTSTWTSLEAHKDILRNKRYVNRPDRSTEMTVSIKPIELWWVFIIFLLAMSFLWLEPKL